MRIITLILLLLSCCVINAQQEFTLKQAIEYGKEHSNQLKLANLDVEDADAQITEFKSIGLPKVSGSLNYQYFLARPVNPVEDFITPTVYQVLEFEDVAGVDPFVGPPELFEFSFFQKNNISANLDASILLFDGSFLTGLKAAKLFKELTRKGIDVKEEEIIANITRAYMNILIAKENKDILAKNIKNIENSLAQAKASYESGFMEQLDVDRLQLSLQNLKTEHENIDQVIATTKDLLKFQMTYPINQDIIISENIKDLVQKLSLNESGINEEVDFNNRAEYAQIELGYELNELNVERFKKGYLPSIVANANFNESLQRDNLFDSDVIGWIPQASVSIGVNIPIYDGAEKKGKIKQAEIELQKLDLQKQEFQRGVRLQVQAAELKLKQAIKTLSNREYTLDITESIYEKTQIKFKEGVGSSIELTQAEQQLFAAQANYISALYELLITRTDLDIALGTL